MSALLLTLSLDPFSRLSSHVANHLQDHWLHGVEWAERPEGRNQRHRAEQAEEAHVRHLDCSRSPRRRALARQCQSQYSLLRRRMEQSSLPTVSRSVASEHQQMSALFAACSPEMMVPGPRSAARGGCSTPRCRPPAFLAARRSDKAGNSLGGNAVARRCDLRWLAGLDTPTHPGAGWTRGPGSLAPGEGKSSIAPAGTRSNMSRTPQNRRVWRTLVRIQYFRTAPVAMTSSKATASWSERVSGMCFENPPANSAPAITSSNCNHPAKVGI